MPDDNRFEDIASQMDDSDADEASESQDSNESETSGDAMPSGDRDDNALFSFDEAEKKSIYGRREVIEEFETALKLADAELASEHGIGDVEGRELQETALEIAAENYEEIARRLAEKRQENAQK